MSKSDDRLRQRPRLPGPLKGTPPWLVWLVLVLCFLFPALVTLS